MCRDKLSKPQLENANEHNNRKSEWRNNNLSHENVKFIPDEGGQKFNL